MLMFQVESTNNNCNNNNNNSNDCHNIFFSNAFFPQNKLPLEIYKFPEHFSAVR